MLGNLYRTLFVIIIVLPFLGQAIPYPAGVSLFLPIAILLAPAVMLLRIADEGVQSLRVGDSAFMAISAATILTYFYGLVISVELQWKYALWEVANGIVSIMIVFSVANSGWTAADRDNLVNALAWAMLVIGVFVGVLGAWKLWLFVSAGELLDFVVATSGADYPWGTSLLPDYNFYALTILTAILSAMFLSSGRQPGVQAMLAIIIIGLIVVGFLSGSRRFWLLAPVFIGLQAFWMISLRGIRPYSTLCVTLLVFLAGTPIAVLFFADENAKYMMTTGWDMLTSGWDLQYRMMTILDSSQGFGMGDRFELWYFAIDRLEGAAAWFGSGFDYVTRYGCAFGECDGSGYPHMPLLSAYLYGGWIAGIVVFALYAYITFAGIRLFAHGSVVGWLCFPLMAAFLFASISGNGPYSIRSHIILGALCVGFLRAANIDDASVRRREATSEYSLP